MSEPKKLNAGQKHMLRLVVKGRDESGWAPVSRRVMPLIQSEIAVPHELVEFEVFNDGSGRVRLTDEGQSVLDAMAWLI